MDSKLFIIGIIGFSVLVTITGIVVIGRYGNAPQVTATENAQIEASSLSYDFGSVPIRGGNIIKTFDITNIGSETLKLYNIKTSCQCTSAQVSTDSVVSPLFKMHSKSDYIMEIPPGENATLKIDFDPLFHGPNALGPINRVVTLETNDAKNPVINFSIDGLVVQ